jgi:uncharacterized protein YlxW (UPF0749 family)
MKKGYMLIISISAILGITIGIMSKSAYKNNNSLVYTDTVLNNELDSKEQEISKLSKQKEKIEKQLKNLQEKHIDKKDQNHINSIKSTLSYGNTTGEGIIINIDSSVEEEINLANLIESKNILVDLVNELKINGGEVISINNQTLNQYSDIVLAGNHININATPIAPPYEIKVIGNRNMLSKNISKDNEFIKHINKEYRLYVNITESSSINIPKIQIEKELKYIKSE